VKGWKRLHCTKCGEHSTLKSNQGIKALPQNTSGAFRKIFAARQRPVSEIMAE